MSISRRLAPLALLLTLASPAMAELFALEFESKLLIRERSWGRRIEVDQWAGAELLVRRSAQGDGERYQLQRVLETPWTLRWYPTKGELKLGAVFHVPEPSSDPYGALASRAEPIARAKHALWWRSDPPIAGPEWAAESGRFWAQRHGEERATAPPLSEPSTYPFHVLGRLDDRFEVTVDGGKTQVEQRMTEPWLRRGWQRWLEGERPDGYGYWGDDARPFWEPSLYESIALAHELFNSKTDEQLRVTLARLVETMQPRAEGRAERWLTDERLRLRVWRPSDGRREIQLLLDDRGEERRKLFVRIGYRPFDAETNSSGN